MKRILFIVAAITLFTNIVYAQNEKNSFLWSIDRMLNLSSTNKMDTNYYTIAKNGWMINVNNNFAGFLLTSEINNVPLYGTTKMNLHSKFNYQLSSTFGYRNLILGYSLANVIVDGKDFTLSLSANAWGVEFRRLATSDVAGNVTTSALGEDFDVKSGDVKIKTKYLRAYYVFNNKKYSTTAAIDQRCVQKKSAGSLLFYTNYSQNTLTLLNNEIINRFNGIKVLEYSQAELSLGYGYNFTPNQGRLLFHADFMPMFVVMTSNYLTDDSLKEINTKSKYFFNCMGRFTVNYRFNDHFGLCFSAFMNTNRFTSEDNIKIRMYDYLIKTSLCFRF